MSEITCPNCDISVHRMYYKYENEYQLMFHPNDRPLFYCVNCLSQFYLTKDYDLIEY